MPNPTINIAASGSVICEGESVSMQLSGADSYTWQTPGLSGTSVTVTPSTPTAYDVSGTNSFGCTSTAQHIVIVHPKPNVTASANPTLICEGGTATLSASGADSFSWDTGGTAGTTTVSPSSTTVYSVTGTENTNGCSATETVQVSVYIATISVTQNTFICPGTSALLSAGAATSYTWANGVGTTQNVNVSPTSSTVYTVSATKQIGIQNCIASNTVMVDIYPQPTVTASSPRPAVCRNEKIVFTASGTDTYLWNNGMTVKSFTLTALTTNPFTFTVTGTDTNGCKATDAITVTVGNCTGMKEEAMSLVNLYPNPNNGTFVIEAKDKVDIRILNELGQVVKIFRSAEGQISVNELSKGVYIVEATAGDERHRATIIVE